MKIALLGFGTVGKGFYDLTVGRSDLTVSAVLSRRPRPELSCTVTADFTNIERDGSIDTVVEVMDGLEPAYDYICRAMRAGKNVVTANKQLMCAHYDELLALANECGVSLRCTAAAGGGIPWLLNLGRAAELDRLVAVEGILNGTTNYMLSAMTASPVDYASILREAQQLGYAEADPTADVEGYDARRKLVLSVNLAFGVSIEEESVPCFGISSVTPADIENFRSAGYTCKLFTRGECNGGKVSAFVCPTLFPVTSPEAHTNGTGNLVSLYAERYGKQSLSGAGAGGWPTGSGVLRDCIEIMDGCGTFYTKKHEKCAVDNSAAIYRFYLRVDARATYTEAMSVEAAFAMANEHKAGGHEVFLARIHEA
ncbi:MAG: homoserine dehydrogenase [Oscillospiraceae bacterium]|nr:homoserine dehydrogenase [Oscillospiraceae bacterium]